MLEVTDPAETMNLSEEAKHAMNVMRKVINFVCSIKIPSFCNIEELHKVDV